MEQHPGPEKLRRFVAGELPKAEARTVMSHILQGCHFCREEASRYNFLHLRQALRSASAGRVAAGDRHYPAFASSAARSKM